MIDLNQIPPKSDLLHWFQDHADLNSLKVNTHIHTPYSFSSFDSIEQAVELASLENIKVLGINDFFVADGYDDFIQSTRQKNIYPLFNIEFIGLLAKAQSGGIRINDPNNPGRIYFTGKGLKYPFSVDNQYKIFLSGLLIESQIQVKKMIDLCNDWFSKIDIKINLNYDEVKTSFAKVMVRERHIAKAIRVAVFEYSQDNNERIALLTKIFGGKDLKSSLNNLAALDNEIRNNLLKAGGKAFVEEDPNSFPDINTLIKIIVDAGGIPCYPVLLDDATGKVTEFEKDFETLYTELKELGIGCIELIPNRNQFEFMKPFVLFFQQKGFVVLFGTEHNTPDMPKLTPVCRENKEFDQELFDISYQNACVVAAHQYLVSKGEPGFVDVKTGKAFLSKKDELSVLGNAVIKYYTKQ